MHTACRPEQRAVRPVRDAVCDDGVDVEPKPEREHELTVAARSAVGAAAIRPAALVPPGVRPPFATGVLRVTESSTGPAGLRSDELVN
jgi:hypothetical protein